MRILKARFRSGKDFLSAFEQGPESRGLFVPTTRPVAPGELVVVEVHFPGLPNKMMVRGRVVWWRAALPRLRVRAGAMVSFLSEDRDRMEFILAAAEGQKKQAVKRRHPRIPVALPVRWRAADSTRQQDSELRDISIGGALLVTGDKPAVGSDVILELTTPGAAQPMDIAARVTHENPSGVGVRFLYRDGGGSVRLREVVRRLVEAP